MIYKLYQNYPVFYRMIGGMVTATVDGITETFPEFYHNLAYATTVDEIESILARSGGTRLFYDDHIRRLIRYMTSQGFTDNQINELIEIILELNQARRERMSEEEVMEDQGLNAAASLFAPF